MFPCKQMKAMTSKSRIEELPAVEKHLGGEGSPGHLDLYWLPLLTTRWTSSSGRVTALSLVLQKKSSKVINTSVGECSPGYWTLSCLITWIYFDQQMSSSFQELAIELPIW